jgi:hypothetical protein
MSKEPDLSHFFPRGLRGLSKDEIEQQREDAEAMQREHEDFEDSPGNLSEALGRARAGEMSWEQIESYGLRARRAAQSCNSLADAFAAELKYMQEAGKAPGLPYLP